MRYTLRFRYDRAKFLPCRCETLYGEELMTYNDASWELVRQGMINQLRARERMDKLEASTPANITVEV